MVNFKKLTMALILISFGALGAFAQGQSSGENTQHPKQPQQLLSSQSSTNSTNLTRTTGKTSPGNAIQRTRPQPNSGSAAGASVDKSASTQPPNAASTTNSTAGGTSQNVTGTQTNGPPQQISSKEDFKSDTKATGRLTEGSGTTKPGESN